MTFLVDDPFHKDHYVLQISMRIVSLNTNRSAKRIFEHIRGLDPDIILLQEWADHRKDRSEAAVDSFPGQIVSATRYLATVARGGFETIHSEDRVLITRHEDTIVVNTYVPASGPGRARREHLEHLGDILSTSELNPDIIAGDFNLAPRLEDGWHGNNYSKYTTAGERSALAEILESYGLTDMGSKMQWEATFERMNRGKMTSFRCDLALVGGENWELTYEHKFRNEKGLSDHSALILDMGGD